MKIVLGLAIGAPLFMWLFQERMLFFPRPLEFRPAPRPNIEEVSIVATDGVKLRGWLVKGNGARPPLVIYFGGKDRKSTRLNSSHTVISYAVFCLKKKKIAKDTTHTTQINKKV